ncbi:MAG: histidinol-phosphatase HisJ family protein [Firmicutes bacterium]|nr:histidinol-phosphatase HisJ family protein [Bacillota bacterium]
MLVDYHMHLERDTHTGPCPYKISRIEEYVRAAERRGLHEIGITEHCHRFREFREIFRPIFDGPRRADPEVAWLSREFGEFLERYVEVLIEAQERGLPVKVGLEVDWIPGAEDVIRDILKPYPWDYIVGSVHFLGDWPIDVSSEYGWPQANPEDAYRAYFAALASAADSGLFDVLAHPDLIKKFGHRVANPEPYYRQAVAAAAASGVALEVSTAGWRVAARELYPAPEFLALAHKAGLAITLASDAHDPADVGRDVAEAAERARQAGFAELAVFSRRRRQTAPLSAP